MEDCLGSSSVPFQLLRRIPLSVCHTLRPHIAACNHQTTLYEEDWMNDHRTIHPIIDRAHRHRPWLPIPIPIGTLAVSLKHAVESP